MSVERLELMRAVWANSRFMKAMTRTHVDTPEVDMFSRLPAEIRLMVYDYLFLDYGHEIVVNASEDDEEKPKLRLNRLNYPNSRPPRVSLSRFTTLNSHGYGLLTACKLTSRETIPLCYPTVRFVLLPNKSVNTWFAALESRGHLHLLKKVAIVLGEYREKVWARNSRERSVDDWTSEVKKLPEDLCSIMTTKLQSTEDVKFFNRWRVWKQGVGKAHLNTDLGPWEFQNPNVGKLSTAIASMSSLTRLALTISFGWYKTIEDSPYGLLNFDKIRSLEISAVSVIHIALDSQGETWLLECITRMRNLEVLKMPAADWIRDKKKVDNVFLKMPRVRHLYLEENCRNQGLYDWETTLKDKTYWHGLFNGIMRCFGSRLCRLDFFAVAPVASCTVETEYSRNVDYFDAERRSEKPYSFWITLARFVQGFPMLKELSIMGHNCPGPTMISPLLRHSPAMKLHFQIQLDVDWAKFLMGNMIEGRMGRMPKDISVEHAVAVDIMAALALTGGQGRERMSPHELTRHVQVSRALRCPKDWPSPFYALDFETLDERFW